MNPKKASLEIYKAVRATFGGYDIERFYPVRVVHGLLIKNLKSDFAIVLGHKMFLDSKDSLDLSINGIFEEYETELVRKEIKRGNVVLDIGANIGYYTLIFAKLVGEDGKVFAFEPDPTNFALLKKNIEINGYKNVVLVQKAVSDKSGKIKLYLSESNEADHRIYDSRDGRKFVEIEGVKLDDYFKNYDGKIDFIKMDIQGAEGRAVQGMTDLLKKNKNIKVTSEFWPIGLKRSGVDPADYLKLLLAQGFKLYEINEQKKLLHPANIANMLKTYVPEKENYTNLLCVKEM